MNDPTKIYPENDNTVKHSLSNAGGSGSSKGEKTEVLADTGQPSLSLIEPGYILKDRFVLETKLGEGAMGMVFLARDLVKVQVGNLNPFVAIKLISGQLVNDPRAFVALDRESTKAQKLAHPNIITVFDFDREGDVFYMTMEALEGETLDDYIKRDKGKNRQEALRIIRDIANGIEYAHKRLIIHSDLKPQNIFLTKDSEVKVLDFGIARAYSESLKDDESTRAISEMVGMTPPYASYEMFEGHDAHPADDVYALGIIAYELLAGEHPFERKRATTVFKEHLVPKKIPGLKQYQWRAIVKALSIDRDKRFQHAGEFVRKFSGVGRVRRNLATALVVMIYVLAAYIYFRPVPGPEIPLVDLHPQLQSDVTENLERGERALGFRNHNDAIYSFDEAYRLHERNPQAVKGIDETITMVFGFLKPQQTPEELKESQREISMLLDYQSVSQNFSKRLNAAKQCLTPEKWSSITCCLKIYGIRGCVKRR